MKTINMITQCLTYEQLQSYTANNSKAERTRLYMHISTCELCTCAVNGFAAIPFISDDVVAIHHEIDARTSAPQANPLTFAQACIVIASIVSIFCFYKFVDNLSLNKTEPLSLDYLPFVAMPKEKRELEISENKAGKTKLINKRTKIKEHQLPKKLFLPIEKMTGIDVRLPEIASKNTVNDISTVAINSDVIYIYDLKVADYSHLYFKDPFENFDLKNYTPPSKENKNASAFENDSEQHLGAHNILKRGLSYFNKSEYNKAAEQFQLLLENNMQDENALFYNAVALYETGKFGLAIKYLKAILQNTNTVFHPEAKWYLALALNKTGDKESSKQLLTEIAAENGFYSKQAKELLKL
jgi:tetratricopeptide (TPR) repeat protein